MYWLELIGESNVIAQERLIGLLSEFNEIVAMVASSQKTIQNRPDAKSKIENPDENLEWIIQNRKSEIQNESS